MCPSRTIVRCLAAAGVWALVSANAAAQPPVPGGSIEIPRVTRPPTLDDFLKGTPREAERIASEFAP